MLADVVEAKVERQSLRRSLEDELGQSRFVYLPAELVVEIDVIEPGRQGYLQYIGGLNHGVPGVEALCNVSRDFGKHLGEELLAALVEGESVPVRSKAVYEVLGEVGTPRHAELAEESQTAAVQPYYRLRTSPTGRLVGQSRLLFDGRGLAQHGLSTLVRHLL